MDKERRGKLQRLATICGDSPVSAGWGDRDGPATYLSGEELRALLDLAEERDRYREAVKQAYVDGHHDGYCDAPIMWPGWDEDRAKESWEKSDVKAALEGKDQ